MLAKKDKISQKSYVGFAIAMACLLQAGFLTRVMSGDSSSSFLYSTDSPDDNANAPTKRAIDISSRMAYIVTVENRDLETEKSYGYYTFAMWKLYSDIHPHVSLLAYNSSSICDHGKCTGYNGTYVNPYWMKILAMLHASEEAKEGDLIVFVDTDMQLLNANFTQSVFDMHEIKSFLHSGKSMMVVDERKHSHWYTVNRDKGLYRAPIVSNLFVIVNNRIGKRMLEIWWQSMNHPTKWDPSGIEMRSKWPYEQERLAAYYDAAPDLFFALNQSWDYMGMHHGPLCCVGFSAKPDIIRSLNETLMNQAKTLSLHNGSYEELTHDLFHQIRIQTLRRKEIKHQSHYLKGFWNATKAK